MILAPNSEVLIRSVNDWKQVKQGNFMTAAQWQQLHAGQRSQRRKKEKLLNLILARPKFTWSYGQFGFVIIMKRIKKKSTMHKTELII